MALERDTFTVYVQGIDDKLAEHTAVITHQDMLRGEKALVGDPGGSDKLHLALVTSWCWASLMRQGNYGAAWQQFRDQDCQGVEKGEPIEVDPTPRGTDDDSP